MGTAEGRSNRENAIRAAFIAAGISVVNLRHIPHADEDVFLVDVPADQLEAASIEAERLDIRLSAPGAALLTSVRRSANPSTSKKGPLENGVQDPRSVELRQLLSARSRTSEAQPSLAYIPDASMNTDAAATPRHQLIFGRRGAGKTALMVEAKRKIEASDHLTAWINIQTVRLHAPNRVLLYILDAAFESLQTLARLSGRTSPTIDRVRETADEVRSLLDEPQPDGVAVTNLIPNVNTALKRYLEATGKHLYLFIDDFYYVSRKDQAPLLDMLHACVRDANCYLKIASIRNLTKWFITSPPQGLETGHDADLIDLDITLQDPYRAKQFLEQILDKYATTVGIPRLTEVFSPSALDRLTLASGGVPRDYLLLAGAAILKTRARESRKFVGVQDVNEAAGDAAQVKVQELEEDGSSNKGVPEQASKALLRVREFCLVETSYTYFRVRHNERDHSPESFAVLNRLVEFRLLHLLAPSVSNPHRAGDASEVYMLDLSQFTGSRLKQKLWVLDIDGGVISAKRTRDAGSGKRAAESRELTAIFRQAPEFALSRLADLVAIPDVARNEVLASLSHGQTRTLSELVSELRLPFSIVSLTVDELLEAERISVRTTGDQDVYELLAKQP